MVLELGEIYSTDVLLMSSLLDGEEEVEAELQDFGPVGPDRLEQGVLLLVAVPVERGEAGAQV